MAEPVEQAPPAPVTEVIEETTVGMLGAVRVPMGNMTVGGYTLPDGTARRGWICSLALEGGGVFVGEGSRVTVGGAVWEVVAVQKAPGELGSVTLRQVSLQATGQP